MAIGIKVSFENRLGIIVTIKCKWDVKRKENKLAKGSSPTQCEILGELENDINYIWNSLQRPKLHKNSTPSPLTFMKAD